MRRFLYAFSIVLSFSFVWNVACAQGNKTSGAPLSLNWNEVGPNNIGNHARALHVSSDGTVWAGAVGGGLWKSINGGLSWSQVPGFDDNMAVSCIASEGANVYVGTGESYFYRADESFIPQGAWNTGDEATFKEGFFEYAGMPGEGVFVSNDAGATWTHNNGTWNSNSTEYNDDFMSIQSIAVKGGRVLIATLAGLYYSTDANLATVTKSGGVSAFQNGVIMDIEFGNGNIVYATTADSLYKSTNSGTSFGAGLNAAIPTDPVPNNRVGGTRVEVAVSASNPSTIYVTGVSLINGNCTGVWKSTDDGTTWERKAPFESGNFAPFANDGRYACVLEVNPTNPDEFFLGGSTLYKYNEDDGLIDAASHFYVPGFSTNYVPSPQLALAFDPSTDSTLYVSGDAEIVKSEDLSETYYFRTKGFNTAHLYAVSAAANYKVLGSDRFRGLIYKDNANSNSLSQQFSSIFSGSPGIGRFSLTNQNYIVAQVADGGLNRSLSNGGAFESFYGIPLRPIHPSLEPIQYIDRPDSLTQGAGLWDDNTPPVNPWTLDEYIPSANLGDDTLIMNTPAYLFLCSRKYVWLCTNPFGTLDSLPAWNHISPEILSTNTFPREYFTAIAVSGDANHYVYVGTNHGRLFRIEDAIDPANLDLAVKFDTIIDQDLGINGSMPDRWITDIAFDPNDPNNMVITYGAYETSAGSRVYITNNAMDITNPVTFRDIGASLPAGLPVYTAAIHPNPNMTALMVGTESGLYTTTDDWTNSGSTVTWNDESGAMGAVPVYDIYVRPFYQLQIDNDNWRYAPDWTIFTATHGRGMFRSNSAVGQEEPVAPQQLEITLYPNPSNEYAFVQMELTSQSQVMIEIFSLDGRKVATLANRTMSAGQKTIQLPVNTMNNGVYLVNAKVVNESGEFTKTMKAVIAK